MSKTPSASSRNTNTWDSTRKPAHHSKKAKATKSPLFIQLAVADQVYLFRLNKCGFCTPIRQLLENKQIFKIGVGIRDDIRNLGKTHNFTPASFIELQEYAEHFGITDKSFSKLMAIIFKVRISKRQQVTNWEAPQLSEAQLRYAATDAWGALRMYQELTSLS